VKEAEHGPSGQWERLDGLPAADLCSDATSCGKAPAAQFALLSVLKCREEPAKCPLLGTLHDMRVSANAALRQKRPVEPACNLAELDEATSDLPFLTRLAQANSKGFIAERSS
jgi:hypothetical protein